MKILTGAVVAPLALGIVVKAVALGGRGACLAGPGVVGSAKKGLISIIPRGLERGSLEPQLRVCGGE